MMERFFEHRFSEKKTFGSVLAHFHQKFRLRTLMTKFYYEIIDRRKCTKLYFQLIPFLTVLTSLTIVNLQGLEHMLKLSPSFVKCSCVAVKNSQHKLVCTFKEQL